LAWRAKLVIWAELEATHHDRAGPRKTLTNAEGDNLVASLSNKRPTGESQAKIEKQQR